MRDSWGEQMTSFILHHGMMQHASFPEFSLAIREGCAISVYSDTDMQSLMMKALRKDKGIAVVDFEDGLYTRLTIENNIAFFHKWYGCAVPVPEILVQFELQGCAKKPLRLCNESDIRRLRFAVAYMSGAQAIVFCEPIQGIDVRTVNTFLNMLQKMKADSKALLVLVSNIDHALLVGDVAYKLQPKAFKQIETAEENTEAIESNAMPKTNMAKLFKIPVKVDDNVILFDPPEVDYLESHDGKTIIYIEGAQYSMDATLTELEKKFAVYGFYRCHRSYIVNLQKVREIIIWSKNSYSLRLDNKAQSTIPLSRTKIQDIMDKFNLT